LHLDYHYSCILLWTWDYWTRSTIITYLTCAKMIPHSFF